jgi:uncharacterized membrane-anchored protein YhcB (DUF1043 family)
MEEGLIIYKIASALIVPIVIGLIKMYGDGREQKQKLKSIQTELHETKSELRADLDAVRTECQAGNDKMTQVFDKRFEKLERLVQDYFTWQRENGK